MTSLGAGVQPVLQTVVYLTFQYLDVLSMRRWTLELGKEQPVSGRVRAAITLEGEPGGGVAELELEVRSGQDGAVEEAS